MNTQFKFFDIFYNNTCVIIRLCKTILLYRCLSIPFVVVFLILFQQPREMLSLLLRPQCQTTMTNRCLHDWLEGRMYSLNESDCLWKKLGSFHIHKWYYGLNWLLILICFIFNTTAKETRKKIEKKRIAHLSWRKHKQAKQQSQNIHSPNSNTINIHSALINRSTAKSEANHWNESAFNNSTIKVLNTVIIPMVKLV